MQGVERVVLVTGANRGLGLEVVRQLASRHSNWHVLLAARTLASGENARQGLGPNVRAVELDVLDETSVAAAAERVKREYGGLDVLVNNAGVMLSYDQLTEPIAQQTLAVNFYGLRRVTQAFLPILRERGLVVNVSSGLGELTSEYSDELRGFFLRPELTEAEVLNAASRFELDVRANRAKQAGWRPFAYAVSKALVNAYTRVLSRDLAAASSSLSVVSVCPGWCVTDMGGRNAPRSATQGASSIAWAAEFQNPPSISGGFYRDGAKIEW